MKIDYSKCSKWKDEYTENGAKGLIEAVLQINSPKSVAELIICIDEYEVDPTMYDQKQLSGIKQLAKDIVTQAKNISAISY